MIAIIRSVRNHHLGPSICFPSQGSLHTVPGSVTLARKSYFSLDLTLGVDSISMANLLPKPNWPAASLRTRVSSSLMAVSKLSQQEARSAQDFFIIVPFSWGFPQCTERTTHIHRMMSSSNLWALNNILESHSAKVISFPILPPSFRSPKRSSVWCRFVPTTLQHSLNSLFDTFWGGGSFCVLLLYIYLWQLVLVSNLQEWYSVSFISSNVSTLNGSVYRQTVSEQWPRA